MESSSEADDDDTNDDEEEELEVVDFNDVAKLFEPTKKSKKISPKKSSVEAVEARPIGGLRDNNFVPPSASSLHQLQHGLTDIDALTKMIDENLSATERSMEGDVAPKYTHNGPVIAEAVEPSLFYTETQPTPLADRAPPSNPLPSDDFDDDIIVYVAPHPRNGFQTSPEKQPLTNGVSDTSQFTPYVRDASLSLALASSSPTATTIQQQPTEPQAQAQIPSMSSFSFSFATPEGKLGGRLRIPPVTTPRLAKSWKQKRGVLSKKVRGSFRTFGAMREEDQLRDPNYKERRRGDSDLDWGDTDGDDDSGSEHDHVGDRVADAESPSRVVNGNVNGRDKGKGKARNVEGGHGMEVDSDLDLNAMQQFVGGLLGENAGRHLTMDDLMDEEQIMLENEQGAGEDSTSIAGSGSEESSEDEDAEVERVLADEEAMLISEMFEFEDEDEEEDDGSEDDEDEDQTPRTSFQKRLERLRNKASLSKHDDEHDLSDDNDDMLGRNMKLAENYGSPRVGFNNSRVSVRARDSRRDLFLICDRKTPSVAPRRSWRGGNRMLQSDKSVLLEFFFHLCIALFFVCLLT